MTRALVFIALVVALFTIIPWRRESPRHRFILDQLQLLCEEEPTSPPAEGTGHELDVVVGVHNGSNRPHI